MHVAFSQICEYLINSTDFLVQIPVSKKIDQPSLVVTQTWYDSLLTLAIESRVVNMHNNHLDKWGECKKFETKMYESV